MDGMHPSRHRLLDVFSHICIGEIAIDPKQRRAAILHDHLALRLFISPAHNDAVRTLCPKPSLRGMNARRGWQSLDLVAAKNTGIPGEVARWANHSWHRPGTFVVRGQRSHSVGWR